MLITDIFVKISMSILSISLMVTCIRLIIVIRKTDIREKANEQVEMLQDAAMALPKLLSVCNDIIDTLIYSKSIFIDENDYSADIEIYTDKIMVDMVKSIKPEIIEAVGLVISVGSFHSIIRNRIKAKLTAYTHEKLDR